jgi:hypothetical protein
MTGASEPQPEVPAPIPDRKPEPPPAASRPVLLAAVLGGLAGAAFSFVLARTFPAVPVTPPLPPPTEARQFAGRVIGALKDGKNDEFMGLLRPAFARMSDKEFAEFCQTVFLGRANAPNTYGPGGEFEFFNETAMSPTLVRVSYLEKYARGCMVWKLVVYDAPDGWQMTAFSYESGFPILR